MAHFYGTLIGNRGQTTRCGSADSGMLAKASGWNIGGITRIEHTNVDKVTFSITQGSNGLSMVTLPSIYLDENDNWTSDNPLMRQLLTDEHY